MLPHRVKRHKSATAIVREFLGPQLAILPEELVWVPAHPSYPDDGGFSYEEMLRAVRRQKHWAFVRVPKEKGVAAVIHFWAAAEVPVERVAHMLGHELGHISGTILDDEAAEEKRADGYGDVAKKVVEMLSAQGRRSRKSPSPAGRASRRAPSPGRGQAPPKASRSSPTPGVQVRKKSKG